MSETKENDSAQSIHSSSKLLEDVVEDEELRASHIEADSGINGDAQLNSSSELAKAPLQSYPAEQGSKISVEDSVALEFKLEDFPVQSASDVSKDSEAGKFESIDTANGDSRMDNTEGKKSVEFFEKPEERIGGEGTSDVDVANQDLTYDHNFLDGYDSGTEEEQAAFMEMLENFHKEKNLEYKPPKFYGEGLNCLKLWRQVAKLGGYDQVTLNKLWRQVGETFRPPKTCTTVSWSFRIFYEKALLEYEKYKIQTGELQLPASSQPESMAVDREVGGNQSSGSGRARRDAASRAMQGWHSQRILGNGDVGERTIKDKISPSSQRHDKNLKSISGLKRKKASSAECPAKVAHTTSLIPHSSNMDVMVANIGASADWVKVNVRKTNDCFEVYALVPGLLREEVHVQSDPGGRLVISGEPEQPDNPWGVTPFKKVITLPSRIDPHLTSAVVTLHGQLFVRAPFPQSES